MKLLVTTGHPDMERFAHPALGRLIQPRHTSSVEATDAAGVTWAADNDCFQGLDAPKYRRMLERIVGLSPKFVTVPDAVGDALATASMFEDWQPQLRELDLPVALVLQDGLEEIPSWLAMTWDRIDAVFVGGTTEWKLGPVAANIVAEAHARDKWVHVGRVNTLNRIDYCRDVLEADSIDGSKWARWKNAYLAKGLDYIGAGDRQLVLA